MWDLRVHRQVKQQLSEWRHLENKVLWTLLQLALDGGKTVTVKGFAGSRIPWRRTPVEGNHFYLWWVPEAATGVEHRNSAPSGRGILVRGILHHDDTTAPDIGDPVDYQPVELASLDPRYGDQKVIATVQPHGVELRLVSGTPGSGKTIALLFAAIEWARSWSESVPDREDMLYVTYTPYLADQARSYFEAYQVSHRIRVRTLDQLENEILGKPVQSLGDRGMDDPQQRVWRFLESQPGSRLGPWRKYPQALWAELRAYLIGMALPVEWHLPSRDLVDACEILDRSVYAKVRSRLAGGRKARLPGDAVARACELANSTLETGLLEEQTTARLAFEKLLQDGGEIGWLGDLNAVIVDEIQDLTVLQIALLAEVGRKASTAGLSRPLLFLAAGDESQIVQPSGFDWGMVKHLLNERLGSKPNYVELSQQRRSPQPLAQLIERSWDLYRHLPKESRPQGKAGTATDNRPAEGGTLLRWRIGETTDWVEVFRELGEYPDLAVVDLGGEIPAMADRWPEDIRSLATLSTYTPSQIKGLQRTVIVVMGFDNTLGSLSRYLEHFEGGETLALLPARRAIDDVRVAISRSTEVLILAEKSEAPLACDLGIGDVDVIDWSQLRDYIKRAMQDLTAFDRIAGYLRNAEDSLQQGDYERAQEQNRQAQKLLVKVDDPVLRAQVEEQGNEINHKLDAQKLRQYLHKAREHLRNGEYTRAYDDWQQARLLLAQVPDLALRKSVHDFKPEIEPHLPEIAEECRKGAQESIKAEQWTAAVQKLRKMAEIRRLQGKPDMATALDCLADRYEQVPPPVSVGDGRLTALVERISRYVEILKATGTGKDEKARSFAEQWVREAYGALGDQAHLYPPWARAACQIADWKGSDLGSDFPNFAPDAWMAAEKLRRNGNPEEALDLMQMAKCEDIPVELDCLVALSRSLRGHDWRQASESLQRAEVEYLAATLETTARVLRDLLCTQDGA